MHRGVRRRAWRAGHSEPQRGDRARHAHNFTRALLAAAHLLDPQHVAVPRKVVELIDVDSVAVVAHNVVEEVLPVATLEVPRGEETG